MRSILVEGEQRLYLGVVGVGQAFDAPEPVRSMYFWIMFRRKQEGLHGAGINTDVLWSSKGMQTASRVECGRFAGCISVCLCSVSKLSNMHK